MEPDVIINCGRKCNDKCGCIKTIIAILVILFAFVLGVIIQSVFGIVAALTLAYFIAIITGLAIAIILLVIYAICKCRRRL